MSKKLVGVGLVNTIDDLFRKRLAFGLRNHDLEVAGTPMVTGFHQSGFEVAHRFDPGAEPVAAAHGGGHNRRLRRRR